MGFKQQRQTGLLAIGHPLANHVYTFFNRQGHYLADDIYKHSPQFVGQLQQGSQFGHRRWKSVDHALESVVPVERLEFQEIGNLVDRGINAQAVVTRLGSHPEIF
ncbi:hypothetical protein ACFL1C_10860, partial [Pseudomonadota bacterium]